MADYVEGFGSLKEPLKPVLDADFTKLALSAQEGFVLSRVDGSTPASLICQMSGLGRDATLAILKTLRNKGVIVIGNEQPVRQPDPEPEPAASDSSPMVSAEEQLDTEERGQLDLEELDGINLKREVRASVRLIYPRLADLNFFELLGVPTDADAKDVRRAYFKRSKQFHPDRYYAKSIGHYKEKLEKIFAQVKSAHEFLQDDTKRVEYRRMVEQEQERDRITADLAQQVRRANSEIGRSSTPTSAQQPLASPSSAPRPAITPLPLTQRTPGQVEGRSRRPTEGRPQAPDLRSGEAARAPDLRSEEAARAPNESGGPVASEASDTGYSFVKGGQSDRVASSDRIPTVRTPRRRSRPVTGGAIRTAETQPDHPVSAPPLDSPERAQRRDEDRRRRRRMSSSGHKPPLRAIKARDFFDQGLRQLEGGKTLAAAASFKLAMTYDPSHDLYKTHYEQAVDASRATTAEGFFRRAIFEESVGRLEAAGKLFVRAAETLPSGAYLRRAAVAMLWVDDLAKAKDYASQAIQNEPNSVDSRLALAEVLLRSGDKKGARREVQLALRLDPANHDASAFSERIKRA